MPDGDQPSSGGSESSLEGELLGATTSRVETESWLGEKEGSLKTNIFVES